MNGKRDPLTRSLTCILIILTLLVLASCAEDEGASVIPSVYSASQTASNEGYGAETSTLTQIPTVSEDISITTVMSIETSEVSTQKESSQETTIETTKETTVATTTTSAESFPPALTDGLTAFSTVDTGSMTEQEISDCFYYVGISDAVFARMEGKSFKADCTTSRSDLRYVRLLHMGFDGQVHVGELVVNKKIAQIMIDVFYDLYLADYPIEKVILVDEYGADDNLSMSDNNTSSFNFRRVVGSTTLSRHSFGMAIDVNPLYNPWVYELGGESIIDPVGGAPYVDRTGDCPYMIDHDDLCYKLLIANGFAWGGDWTTSLDYQHFSKSG